jgi:hypothetical protein
MRILLLISLIVAPSLAFAQTTTDKIFDNLDAIYNLIPKTNNTESQLIRINEKLIQIKRSLRGDQNSFRRLGCASRDNDSRSPWSITYTRSDLSKVKYRNINFDSIAKCERSINITQSVGGQTFLCASRDSDGKSPISIWAVNNLDAKRRRKVIFNNLEQCLESLSIARKTFSSISLCASRDTDGSSPFSTWLLNTISSQRDNSSTYQTLEACLRSK